MVLYLGVCVCFNGLISFLLICCFFFFFHNLISLFLWYFSSSPTKSIDKSGYDQPIGKPKVKDPFTRIDQVK